MSGLSNTKEAVVQSIENWLPVQGYEGRYSVSDLGRVRGPRGHVLRPSTGSTGYHSVGLSTPGEKTRLALVHRLVAIAFIADRSGGPRVLHGDGNPTNNTVANLRWGTDSDNRYDSVRHGTNRQAAQTECVHGHPFSSDNTYIRPNGNRQCRACNRVSVDRYAEKKRREVA